MVVGEVLALLTILFGILVIALPQFLRFVVGSYFILSGILMLVIYY